MCHHNSLTTWCGKCFAKKGIIANHPRIKVKSSKEKPNFNKKKKTNKKEKEEQILTETEKCQFCFKFKK